MRQGTKAWLAIGAGVLAYEAMCDDGEMLSEVVDDWLEHPVGRYVATAAIGATALHLVNMLPNNVDPIHQIGKLKPKRSNHE